MSLGTAIFEYLTNHAGVSAIVETRVYPHRRPQKGGQVPCIVYTRTSGEHIHHLLGASGLCQATYELECHAATYLEAETLSDALRTALDGKRNFESAGVDIRSVMLTSDPDSESPPDSGDTTAKIVSAEYSITYATSVPVHH